MCYDRFHRARKTRVDEVAVTLDSAVAEPVQLADIYQDQLPGGDQGCAVLHLMAEMPYEPVHPTVCCHSPPDPTGSSLPPGPPKTIAAKAVFQEHILKQEAIIDVVPDVSEVRCAGHHVLCTAY